MSRLNLSIVIGLALSLGLLALAFQHTGIAGLPAAADIKSGTIKHDPLFRYFDYLSFELFQIAVVVKEKLCHLAPR